jgi:hypothetical protein
LKALLVVPQPDDAASGAGRRPKAA